MKTRYTEEYLVGARDALKETYGAWHNRTVDAQKTVRGEWTNEDPSTLNLADKMTRDAARLGSEITPSYFARPTAARRRTSRTRGTARVIGEGYFKYSRWDLMRPQLIMDMIVAGAAFTVYWPDPAFPYPRAMRVDPLACFPTIYNNQLLDLLVITEMTVRQAERMFPGIGIAKAAAEAGGLLRHDRGLRLLRRRRVRSRVRRDRRRGLRALGRNRAGV